MSQFRNEVLQQYYSTDNVKNVKPNLKFNK